MSTAELYTIVNSLHSMSSAVKGLLEIIQFDDDDEGIEPLIEDKFLPMLISTCQAAVVVWAAHTGESLGDIMSLTEVEPKSETPA